MDISIPAVIVGPIHSRLHIYFMARRANENQTSPQSASVPLAAEDNELFVVYISTAQTAGKETKKFNLKNKQLDWRVNARLHPKKRTK